MTQKGAAITGKILQEMANKVWKRLPQYSTLERPKFYYGWLHKFRQRHSIRQRIRHAEAAQVDREALKEDLKELQLICDEYQLQDIYDMDETNLFWNTGDGQTPLRGAGDQYLIALGQQ